MKSSAEAHGTGAKFLSVRVGSQDFAIDIMAVREIRGWTQPTPLPQAPAYVSGMINLRGVVIPVLDLGDRLGLAKVQTSGSSVIVVIEVRHRLVGLLVDAVSDLVTVPDGVRQSAPAFGGDGQTPFVTGTAAMADRILSVVSVENIVPDGLAQAA